MPIHMFALNTRSIYVVGSARCYNHTSRRPLLNIHGNNPGDMMRVVTTPLPAPDILYTCIK